MVQVSHLHVTTGKTITLTIMDLLLAVMCLLFNMLSRLVIVFLPRSKHLLTSWLQSPSAAILEPKKIICHCFHFFASICHEVMGPDAMILVFECWVLCQLSHSSLSLSLRGSLVPLCFLPLECYHLHIWEQEMETHSSILAWRILRTEELGGLLSIGPHKVRHD